MEPQEDNPEFFKQFKELYNRAKLKYPDEYDYIIQSACLSYLANPEDIEEPTGDHRSEP